MEENNKNENIEVEKLQKVKELINDKLVRVKNITNYRGNVISNQFEIRGIGFTLFQSYNSPIAMVYHGKTYLFKDWDHSVTTGKYRNQFLGETKKETEAKLKSGEYVAVDFEVC